MKLGSGTISNYAAYISNCTLNQFQYKIPVNNLQDVQLFIAMGSEPSAVEYQLIHTCGPYGGTIENLTTSSYVIGQDTNFEWYGVFKNFDNTANPLSCFVIAITLTIGGNDYIYFSEEYCVETSCNDLVLIKGCYGNLDNRISYDCNGVYFGTHAGEGTPMGDTTIVYQHQLLLRNVEVTRSLIKNTFKQGRTRNFRTEKERIYQFWAEIIPEWYVDEVDAIFNRGEVFVGGVKRIVNETNFEKIEDCKKIWKPTATFREKCYQSFSCEADPCAPPEPTCCDVLGVTASVQFVEESGEDAAHNEITINFSPCEPTPANGYNVQWRVAGSGDAYTDAGNFTDSPAIITDETNPEGTGYEGIVRSDCGELLGNEATWSVESAEPDTSKMVRNITNYAMYVQDSTGIAMVDHPYPDLPAVSRIFNDVDAVVFSSSEEALFNLKFYTSGGILIKTVGPSLGDAFCNPGAGINDYPPYATWDYVVIEEG